MNTIFKIKMKYIDSRKNHILAIQSKSLQILFKVTVFVMLFTFGLTISMFAQEKPNVNRFELEIDPIAYILKGYSFHGIYVHNKIRTDLGVFGILQPEGFGGNDGFQVKTQGVGVKMNYLLNKSESWFAGVGFGYANNNIELIETSESQSQKTLGIGIHLGYRWFPLIKSEKFYKNLYLAPWCSIDYNWALNDVNFVNHPYKQKPVSFFPTIHIGYKI